MMCVHAGSGGQRPVIPPKTLDTTTHSKPVQNEAAIQLPSDIPMVHMLAQNRGEHQPKLKLDKNTMRMCPNPLSPPKSRRNFYPMNSQKHGVALIINNKKLSEGSTYKMADCDELNLTETLKFLGYDVVIKHTCSHDVVVNLFEQIEIQCLDPVKISDSFVCCILSCGDERMLYGADNKPVELKKIQETVSNCQVLKNLPKLFFIQAYMGKQLDPAGHFVLSQCSDFYFSCAVTSSELPFRDPNRGSSYITELCKALCTHSTDMVLSDILKNVGTILKAKHDSNCQLLKEDSQLTKDVYFFHGKAHVVFVKATCYITVDTKRQLFCNLINLSKSFNQEQEEAGRLLALDLGPKNSRTGDLRTQGFRVFEGCCTLQQLYQRYNYTDNLCKCDYNPKLTAMFHCLELKLFCTS